MAACGLYFERLYGPVLAVLSFTGTVVGGFESLPLYAVFIYMMDILFRIVLIKFELNMSCRLIFNFVETFNLSVRS